MELLCSRRCGGQLFRELFAEVDVDAAGEYQAHRVSQPGDICLECGAPAFDLSTVPAGMEAEEAEAERAGGLPLAVDILCPVCETRVQVSDEMECPNCGAPLEVA